MADSKNVSTQEENFSSDSDCSSCDYECCSCVDELRVYEHKIMEQSSFVQHNQTFVVSNCTTSPVQTSKALVSLVVKPSDNVHNIGCFGQDTWSPVKSKNVVDNTVMSLNDLDHYGVMLQGLIDELSTISEKLVSYLQHWKLICVYSIDEDHIQSYLLSLLAD